MQLAQKESSVRSIKGGEETEILMEITDCDYGKQEILNPTLSLSRLLSATSEQI